MCNLGEANGPDSNSKNPPDTRRDLGVISSRQLFGEIVACGVWVRAVLLNQDLWAASATVAWDKRRPVGLCVSSAQTSIG